LRCSEAATQREGTQKVLSGDAFFKSLLLMPFALKTTLRAQWCDIRDHPD
jgi:hypothetical protein